MDDSLTVTRNDAIGHYEIHIGDVLAGYSEFEIDDQGRIVVPHTEIDPEFEGRGLGTVLISRMLADISERGETLVPLCPFVRRYLRSHDVPGLRIDDPFPHGRRAAAEAEQGSGGGGV